MNTIYIHLPPRPRPRPPPIDITPVSPWRRAARTALALLVVGVAVPILWLIGGLVALLLLGGAAVMLALSLARWWWSGRARRAEAGAPR